VSLQPFFRPTLFLTASHSPSVGLPRTGNPTFANAVDSILPKKFSYVVSGRDFVPHVPPRAAGFQHPSGQVWINPANTTNWKFYPGQENIYGEHRPDSLHSETPLARRSTLLFGSFLFLQAPTQSSIRLSTSTTTKESTFTHRSVPAWVTALPR
jgi:hypothetical protein